MNQSGERSVGGCRGANLDTIPASRITWISAVIHETPQRVARQGAKELARPGLAKKGRARVFRVYEAQRVCYSGRNGCVGDFCAKVDHLKAIILEHVGGDAA